MGRASDPAHSSAQSAKETAVKIEEAINKSAHGVQISDKVAQSLSEIIEKARKVDGFVSEIALASKEQNLGISQVNSAVSQMDKVTQSNAASAEETASAAEELNAQAALQMETVVELLNLVGITLAPATGFTENSNAKAATAKAYPPNGKASRAASGSKPGSRIASDRAGCSQGSVRRLQGF